MRHADLSTSNMSLSPQAERRMQTLAKRQRIAIWTFVAQTVVIALMLAVPEEFALFLTLVSIPLSLTFFVQMAALSFASFDRARALGLVLAMAIPVIGWLAILSINHRVTTHLRSMGTNVALLGARTALHS
jgi:hypothetical protein